MNKLQKNILFLLLVVVTSVFSAGEKVDKVRIGLLGNKLDKPAASGIIGFAQEQQSFETEFAKDGIAVEWVFFKGGAPALNEAIANGLIDIASYGDLGSISGKASGLPTKVILPANVGGGKNFILVSSNSSAQSVNDLKGKKVAYTRGTAPQLLWNRYIEKSGYQEKDFRVSSVTNNDQETALTTGVVDIIISNSLDLVDQGSARAIDTVDSEISPLFGNLGIVIATENFITKHNDLVQRWVNTYVNTARSVLLTVNRQEFIRIAVKSGTSAKTVRNTLPQKIEYFYAPVIDDYFKTRLHTAIGDSYRLGLIPREFNSDEWLDPSFLTKALTDQKLDTRWLSLRDISDLNSKTGNI